MIRHALLAIFSLCPTLAAAQNMSDRAAADALFDEGKQLLKSGDIDHACLKFEGSLRLLDRLGARLNLADCHEQQRRTATAWAEFSEAASLGTKHGDARAGYARQRADALAPRLVKLRIVVLPANQLPGLSVRRDALSLLPETFDSALPVDPGNYTIDASAPGYQMWSTTVEVKKPGDVVAVEIPRLVALPRPRETRGLASSKEAARTMKADAGVERKPEDPGTLDRDARHRRHLLGLGVGAGGLAVIGVGVALGFKANSKWRSVGNHCDADSVCDAIGASINHDARLLGDVGTVVGGAGLAVLITGTVLYVTAPAVRPAVEHAFLEVDKDSGVRIGFGGRF
jgi:serine/threonine-protein kinase